MTIRASSLFWEEDIKSVVHEQLLACPLPGDLIGSACVFTYTFLDV